MSGPTKRIRFIVTGDLERTALVPALRRLFPPDADGDRAEWLPTRKTGAGTSMRLRADIMDKGMKALAKAMVAEAWGGEDGRPADLIVVVDDVELHNFDQQPLVCASFRAAVELELATRATAMRGTGRSIDELRMRVRERCSFHLLCPMVEAYLFPDHAALVTAGCAATVEPRLVRPHDCEDFESCDPAWSPTCHTKNERMAASGYPWWQEQRHAKHYLEHLVEQSGGWYNETHAGRRAFETLDWSQVPSNSGYPFVRALLEDLADFFVVPHPLGNAALSSPLTYPGKQVDRRTLLLRNM